MVNDFGAPRHTPPGQVLHVLQFHCNLRAPSRSHSCHSVPKSPTSRKEGHSAPALKKLNRGFAEGVGRKGFPWFVLICSENKSEETERIGTNRGTPENANCNKSKENGEIGTNRKKFPSWIFPFWVSPFEFFPFLSFPFLSFPFWVSRLLWVSPLGLIEKVQKVVLDSFLTFWKFLRTFFNPATKRPRTLFLTFLGYDVSYQASCGKSPKH